MGFDFGRLHEPTALDLAQIQEIYQASFPPGERKPFELIVRGEADDSYICIAARGRGTPAEIAAFALVLPLAETSSALLEYMAVRESVRGQGIGSALLIEAVLYLQRRQVAAGLILEVEPPSPSDGAAAANRRIAFYEKMGATLIEHSRCYRMPDYAGDTANGIPLRLMQLPAGRQPEDAELRQIVNSIYGAAYPGHARLLASILANLRGGGKT